MSEAISKTSAPAGVKPQPAAPAAVPAGAAQTQPPAPVVQPAAPANKPPAAFGGHKGGGKKREDGLVAGSPEAIKADKDKDAQRKRDARAGKKIAALPPALPGVATPPAGAPVPLAAAPNSELDPVAGPVPGAPVVLAPTFVAWSGKMLERPLRLFTRIVDRFRVGKLMERLRKLKLGPEIEAEAERKFAYKAEQVADFNAALTNVAVIELNKRAVGGAQNAHWLELAMTGGELVNCHLDTVDWLEKKIIEKAEREKAAANPEKK